MTLMQIDASKYRGIAVNVEMTLAGRFVPSIHDPLRHNGDAYAKLPRCAADSHEGAVKAARAYIDSVVDRDIDSVRLAVK